MKKTIALFLVMVLLLCTFVGCSTEKAPEVTEENKETVASNSETSEAPEASEPTPAPEEKDSYLIGAISDGLASPYQQGHYQWLKDLAAANGDEVIVVDGQINPEIKLKAVETFIEQGVDVITVQANDNAGADALTQLAQEAGIPMVLFYMPSENVSTPAVVIDEYATSFQLGVTAAEKWLSWYPDSDIKVGILDLPTSSQVHENRTMAFFDGIQSVAPDAELVSVLDGGSKRDMSYSAAQDMLQAHPEINIVYGINSESALGALAAFEEVGRGKAVDGIPQTELFVGTNGSEVEAEKLFDPSSALKLTQALQPKANAAAVLDTMYKLFNGEIKMTDNLIVDAYNVVFTYWDSPIEEYEEFMVSEYLAEPGLAERLTASFAE